jgi:Beta-galactosidase C-terminal domain
MRRELLDSRAAGRFLYDRPQHLRRHAFAPYAAGLVDRAEHQKLPAGVRVKHGAGRAGKPFHYYFNFSAAPRRVVYAYAGGTELLSNRPVASGAALALDPWGVAIVEQEQP